MRRPIIIILISIATLLPAGFSQAALPLTPAQLAFTWSYSGDQQGAELGAAVSGAGDVNGDGFADVLIGAPKYDTDAYKGGAVFGFYGSPAGLSINPDWAAGSDQKGARFGGAVSGAGDVNGDGFADALIGAFRANNGETEEGRVYLYFGSRAGLEATPAWHYESNQKEANLGYSVSGAGDVNGDGFADIIVGAPLLDTRSGDGGTLINAGAALLFYGSGAGLPATPSQVISGTQASAIFGHAVSGAGDVNGDGFADVLVGAPLFDTPVTGEDSGTDAGAVWLFPGSAQGLVDVPAWVAFGPHAGAEFGSAVSGAGDTDRDGFADLLIGAPHLSGSLTDEGAVYLFRGSGGGPHTAATHILYGQQNGSRFGAAVAAAGDFNGDGLAEYVAGAPGYSGDQASEGGIFVYSDSGFAWVGEGNKAETEFGAAVASAGDVNGDGCADIVVGAPTYRIETILHGRAFVAHGSITSLESNYFVWLPIIQKAEK